jgi:hypothetical protein
VGCFPMDSTLLSHVDSCVDSCIDSPTDIHEGDGQEHLSNSDSRGGAGQSGGRNSSVPTVVTHLAVGRDGRAINRSKPEKGTGVDLVHPKIRWKTHGSPLDSQGSLPEVVGQDLVDRHFP